MAYIIYSPKHSTEEKPCFWKANNAGYTYYPFNAGIYSEDQINAEPGYYNDGYNAIAIPLTDKAMEAINFQCSVDINSLNQFLNKG